MVYSLKKFAYIKIGENMANNIREIITQAVIAKGKKRTLNKYPFVIENYDKILGCWITNHRYSATFKNGQPVVLGTFDVHIWYCFHEELDSAVEKHQITYIDDMQVTKKEDREFESSDQVKGRCLNKPKCLSASHNGKDVTMEIEKEMQIEISGETCIKVEVKDEEEIWDDLEDIEINPHFIKS